MSNFKANLWPLLNDSKDETDLESTGRTSDNNYYSHRLRTNGRRTAEFQLTSIYEDTHSSRNDKQTFIKRSSEVPKNNIYQKEMQPVVPKRVVYKNTNYQAMNLTWTLYNINPPKKWFSMLFGLSVVVRAYIFIYLLVILYFTISGSIPTKWMWTIVIISTRIGYAILVIRVSLCYSDGPLEMTLKNCWNKKQILVNEAFQVLTWSSLKRTFVKTLIPPQLSFLYLSQSDVKRKFLMYSVINYIFLSIQTIVFYPFFIMYCLLSIQKASLSFLDINLFTNIALIASFAWVFAFLVFSIYLLISGIIIKYQKMTF